MKLVITKGDAIVIQDGLRCQAPRVGDTTRKCNKLIAKLNSLGQIAGNFMCDRCKQEVSVQVFSQ